MPGTAAAWSGEVAAGATPARLTRPSAPSRTYTRPHRKAAMLALTATPFSSMARSMEAADTGIPPAW